MSFIIRRDLKTDRLIVHEARCWTLTRAKDFGRIAAPHAYRAFDGAEVVKIIREQKLYQPNLKVHECQVCQPAFW